MTVLITAGGTREPIDGVRVIANASTGTTGAQLADAFQQAGWDVLLLRATNATAPRGAVEQRTFVTVHDLDTLCRESLSTRPFDLVIHAAAVSDFVVEAVVVEGVRHPAPLTGKLASAKALSIELVPGKKILPELKGYSGNPNLRLVGFKLTDGATPEESQAAVAKVLAAGADLVVHNDLQTMHTVRATLWDAKGIVATAATTDALADALIGYAKAPC